MEVIVLGMISFLLIFIIIILIIKTHNNFQSYTIRINEAENNIDANLKQRFDLLNRSIDIINAHIKSDDEILSSIIKLRSRNTSGIELDKILCESVKEFKEYKEKYPQLMDSEVFTKIDISLSASNAERTALHKYYNDIVTIYNKKVRSFPSGIIALFCKCKTKELYDE